MAKNCSICGKKLGFLDGKIVISDGVVCTPCWSSAGLDMGIQSLYSAKKRTTKQLKDMIEIEILKTEAEKSGLKNPTVTVDHEPEKLTNHKNTTEKKKV